MKKKIKIAVDAMGGENSPKKVLDAILENAKKNKDIFFNIFGDENINSIQSPLASFVHQSKFNLLVSPDGLEPSTPSLKGKCSTNWAKGPT